MMWFVLSNNGQSGDEFVEQANSYHEALELAETDLSRVTTMERKNGYTIWIEGYDCDFNPWECDDGDMWIDPVHYEVCYGNKNRW